MTISNSNVNRNVLTALLEKYDIPTSKWNGNNGTKKISDLVTEIKNGETVLIEENNKLVRVVNIVVADVLYIDNNTGQKWKLTEEKQVFKKDNTIKRRTNALGAVSEKIHGGENLQLALLRALTEELFSSYERMPNFKELLTRITVKDKREIIEEHISTAYPELLSRYKIHKLTVYLPKELFNAKGYIEHQPTKDIHFVWEETTA